MSTTKLECPQCKSGFEALSVEIKTSYPIICVQGSGFDFFEGQPTTHESLDFNSIVTCQECGNSGAYKNFMVVEEDENKFHNFYRCSCGEEWDSFWSCACDDRCPVCDKEIEPYQYFNQELMHCFYSCPCGNCWYNWSEKLRAEECDQCYAMVVPVNHETEENSPLLLDSAAS